MWILAIPDKRNESSKRKKNTKETLIQQVQVNTTMLCKCLVHITL